MQSDSVRNVWKVMVIAVCRSQAASSSLLSTLAKQLEQLDEEVDDVKVECHRGEDVLLRRHLLHDHAHIIDDVEWEESGSSSGQTDVDQLVL